MNAVFQLNRYASNRQDNCVVYDSDYSSITPRDIVENNRYFQWFEYHLREACRVCQPMKCRINDIEYRPETLARIIHRIRYGR
jgi:hypothetical protein